MTAKSIFLTFSLGDNDFSSHMLDAAQWIHTQFGHETLLSIDDQAFKTAMVDLILGFQGARNAMLGREPPRAELRHYLMVADVLRTREAAERDCDSGAVTILVCPSPHIWLH